MPNLFECPRDNELIKDEELNNLKKICYWINKEPDTEIYVLKDEGEVKSVFALKRFGMAISTTKEMDCGTKLEARGKGYAKVGLSKLLHSLLEREDISTILIQALNPITTKLVEKYDFENDGFGTSTIALPRFSSKYDELCDHIRDGKSLEEILAFCENKEGLLNQARKWLIIERGIDLKHETSNKGKR